MNAFLDMEEVNKLKHLLEKYGDDVGDSPCGLPDGRKCYWFTAADGLPNNNYFDEEDLKFFMQIRANVQDLWPQFNIRDGTGVYDVPEGKTDPYIPPIIMPVLVWIQVMISIGRLLLLSTSKTEMEKEVILSSLMLDRMDWSLLQRKVWL